MPKTKVTVALVAEVCARLLNRESQASIKRRTNLGAEQIGKAIAVMRLHGVAVETIPAIRSDAVREEQLHNYFRTTQMSNREIATATGIDKNAVGKSRQSFDAERVRLGDDLPSCECGQHLHHMHNCWARHRKQLKARGVRAVVTLEPEQQVEVRRRLLAGETLRSVAELADLPRQSIVSFVLSFSPEERHIREDTFVIAGARRRAAKLTRAIARPRATNPAADPLYAKIALVIPRGIDPALRDDMISQAYLEVLEGRIDPKRLREGVKKVRGKIFRTFANPWGNLSIDIATNGDSAHSFAESIPDERALAAFEAVE